MIIFPAIDLKGGQVVRLAEGDMKRATVYADDPAAQAGRFASRPLHPGNQREPIRGKERSGALQAEWCATSLSL